MKKLDNIRAIDRVPADLLRRRLAMGAYRYDADGDLEKRCSTCGDYWPADNEFFYADRGDPDGTGGTCKACYLERRHGARPAAQQDAA
jgi:hypothetical protein